jgi:hypothetical protein
MMTFIIVKSKLEEHDRLYIWLLFGVAFHYTLQSLY